MLPAWLPWSLRVTWISAAQPALADSCPMPAQGGARVRVGLKVRLRVRLKVRLTVRLGLGFGLGL